MCLCLCEPQSAILTNPVEEHILLSSVLNMMDTASIGKYWYNKKLIISTDNLYIFLDQI